MNKTIVALVGLLLFATVAATGYYFYQNKNTSSQNQATTTSDQTSTPHSLRDLLGLSTSQKCTYQDGQGSQGTVYVSGGMVRTDFTTTSSGQTYASHMIARNNQVYTWMDGSQTGYLMDLNSMPEAEESMAQEDSKSQEPVNIDQTYDYQCSAWSPDNSLFDLPSIEFVDYMSMMPSISPTEMMGDEMMEDSHMMQEQNQESSNQCGTCDTLPTEAQEQCRQALGC